MRVPWGVTEVIGDVVERTGPPGHEHVVVALPVHGSSGETLETTTVSVPADSVDIVEAEVVDERDTTPPGMDGWARRYRVLVDGEEVVVNVWCSGTAQAMAPHHDAIKSVVRDRGRQWVLRAARHAQKGRHAIATMRCDSSGPSVSHEYRDSRAEAT